jgi:hypothetical protein
VVTRERFMQGLTLQQYLDQMSINRDRFARALDGITVQPADEQMLARLNPGHVLVITEDWCGTSLAYVPRVAKLVQAHPEIELRFFLRDENPDVMDQYLKRGLYRAIPVFAFFDAEMNEVARFLEAPPA